MDIRKKAMVAALEKSLGVVSTACREVDVPRSVHYDWMTKDEEYAKAVKDLKGVAIDYAESKLFKQIGEGNTTATIFYLKTQGRDRGYVERQQHEIVGGKGAAWFDQVPEGYTGTAEKPFEES